MDSDLNYLYKTFSNQSKNCVATRFVFVVFVLKLNLLVAADFDVSRKVVWGLTKPPIDRIESGIWFYLHLLKFL
jgi:hypothetical protein